MANTLTDRAPAAALPGDDGQRHIIVTYEPGSEEHYRFLVDELGVHPIEAQEIVDICAGRSDGDCVITNADPNQPEPEPPGL